MQKSATISKKILLMLLITLSGAILLTACGEVAVDRRAEIEKAVAYTGFTPLPTVDPVIRAREAFGFSFVIYGIRDYYPTRPGEKITVNLLNERETSFFVSNLCTMLLQRQLDNTTWEDIAFGRPCPPNNTQAFQLYPHTAIEANFVFKDTKPLAGKSWLVEGTYRLLLIYYLRCPDAYNTINYCENKQLAESNYFQLKLDKEIAAFTPSSATATQKP